MQLIISQDIQENKLEAIFCPVFEDSEKLAKAISYFAKNQENILTAQAKKEKFQGQKKHIFVMRLEDRLVVLLGLGKVRRLSSEDWRETASLLVNFLQKYQAKNIYQQPFAIFIFF